MTILISEPIEEAALAVLATAGPLAYAAGLSDEDALGRALATAEAWLVRNRTAVTARRLALAPRLRVVGRLGSGVDNVDVGELRRRGIALVTARGANAAAVAEWVLAYMFAQAKPLAYLDAAVRQGRWPRAEAGRELQGTVLGVLGFGATGRALARRAQALGLVVLAWDPHLLRWSQAYGAAGATPAAFWDVVRRSDFLSLHVPLRPETRHLVDGRVLSAMKPGAHLIQTSRGGVVDEAALAAALRHGRLGGALLDVRAEEPPRPPDPIGLSPKALLTPHVAGLAPQARRRVDLAVAREVARLLAGEGHTSGGGIGP